MRLSGQEYVDLYASQAKELAAKAKDDAKRAEKEAAEAAEAAGTDGADGGAQGSGEVGSLASAQDRTEQKKAS